MIITLSNLLSYTPCNPIPLKWLSVGTLGKYCNISNGRWSDINLFTPEPNAVRSKTFVPETKNTCPLLASTVIWPWGIFNKNLFWDPTYPKSVSAKSIGGELSNSLGLPI